MAFGASEADRESPRFNYLELRQLVYFGFGRYDFEDLPNPPRAEQKLALALYREGLGSNNEFYQFLSFFKTLNIRYSNGPAQIDWINANVSSLNIPTPRVAELQTSDPNADVGTYLYNQGRCAIAHAAVQPIRDPDDPTDLLAIRKDLPVIQELARIFIEKELGVPR
jgi:hypothetical protein